MEDIILTKLIPPEFGTWLLPRERLLSSILSKKDSIRIVEIAAPAGYGKTAFMQQLSQKVDKPLVWIQLDRYDNDPSIFIRSLVAGLRQHWPGLGEKVVHLASTGAAFGYNPRIISSLLINDLVRVGAEPLMVFDDTHQLKDPFLRALLQEVLENSPPGVLSIFAGRTALPLNLSHFHMTGKAHRIGPLELSFSRDEITALLAERYGPQPQEAVEAVERYTGGWPVALELSWALLFGDKTPELQYSMSQSSLCDYLAAEVLEKLQPDHQGFLLGSSVLETLTPVQCDRLLERKDSGEILYSLTKEQLLLTPLAGKENAYRLHQLFRDFLLQRLGERRALLQRRAARQAALDGDNEIAVEYYLQAGFDSEAEKVLEDAGREALAGGRWHTVARWLEQLEDEQVRKNPWFSYFRAVVEVYRGRLYEAERWVEMAASTFGVNALNIGLMECHLLQARLLRCRGRYQESLALLEQAAARSEDGRLRFDLTLEKGYSLFLSGDLKGAEVILAGTLEKARQSGDMLAATYLTEALGNICYQQGKHSRALQLYQWCLGVSTEGSLPGYYILDARPYIFCDWGELKKALELAQNHVAAKEKYQMTESLPSAYSALAYVHFELGNYEKVEELVRCALELHHQYGEERFFLLLNQMVLAWCFIARGHWVEARQLLDRTLTAAEEQADQVCSMVQMLAGTALALMGSLEEAIEILQRSEANLEAMNFRIRLCDAYKALAYVYWAYEDMPNFQKYARKFLQLGERMNYICNRLQFTCELLLPVLRFGLEHDVEVLYVQRMLSHLGPRSHKLLLELVRHPNPAVRQRVVAPLMELADEGMIHVLKELAQDSAFEVRQPAQAYMRLKPAAPEKGIPLSMGKETGEYQLEVNILGPLRLFAKGKEITGWRTRKTRELMGLLVHLNEPAGKDRIREELWPDLEPRRSNALFGTTMYNLRQRLKQESLTDLIQFRQDRYSIKSGACRIDSSSFEELASAGLQQEPLREVGAGLLGKAVRLYRGDYMAEPDDYAWALPRQVHLKNLYIEGLLALSRYWFSRRSYSRAQAYLVKLKEADPLCEPAHRLTLQIHAGLGRQQALLEEHRSFKLLLMEETGLLPCQETETLFRRLINNK